MQWTCPEGNLHKWMRIGIVQFGKKPLPARRRKTKPGSAPSAVLAPCGCILWLVCLVCCFLLLSSLWARPINKCAKRLGPTHAHTDTRSHTLTHAWALITHNQLKFISAGCQSPTANPFKQAPAHFSPWQLHKCHRINEKRLLAFKMPTPGPPVRRPVRSVLSLPQVACLVHINPTILAIRAAVEWSTTNPT